MEEKEKKKTETKKKSTAPKKSTTKSKTTSKKTVTKKTIKKEVSPKKIEAKEEMEEKRILEKETINVLKHEELEEAPPREKSSSSSVKKPPVNNIKIILACILLGICSIAFFIKAKDNVYSSKWDGLSYLTEKEYATEVNCQDIPDTIKNTTSFIYIKPFDETNNEKEFDLEQGLSKIIEKYGLKDKFYVYKVDEKCGSLEDYNSVIGRNLRLEKSLTKVPTIIYYKNGSLIDYIARLDNQMMSPADFEQLLEMYEIKK